MDELRILHVLLNFAILLFSLSLHEFGHAAMADRMGDPTPRMLGRLTMNPIAHADPIGTVLFPLISMYYQVNFLFGWAKPVPITPENFRNPRKGGALVAFAGPLANMGLCLVALVALTVLDLTGFFQVSEATQGTLLMFFTTFFWINFALAIFNLIPIFPLDGSWILKALLPGPWAYKLSLYDRYGAMFLIGIMVFFRSFLGYIFGPVVAVFFLILHLIGLGHVAQYLG